MASEPASCPVDLKLGYPLAILNGGVDIDEKYKCSFCNIILREPVQSHCGHRFCKNCLLFHMSIGQVVHCPTCQKENAQPDTSLLVHDQIFPDNAIKREMAKLKVKCVNEGCSWMGIFREYEIHQLSECAGKKIRCEICTKMIPQDAMLCGEEVNHFLKHHFSMIINQVISQQQNVNSLQKQSTMALQEIQSGINANITNIEDKIEQLSHQIAELRTRPPSSGSQQTATDSSMDLKIRQTVERQTCSIKERLDIKVGTFEGVTSSLHRDLDKALTVIEKLDYNRRELIDTQKQNTDKIRDLERSLEIKDASLLELQAKVLALENISYDGTLLWKITEFTKKQADAIQGHTMNIISTPFYTSRHGYKMCARIYPNGDGTGQGTHLSVFFVIMRGNCDALMRWPFRQRVVFTLLNQIGRENVVDSFIPDLQSSSFQQPTTDMNIASGCPQFVKLDLLLNTTKGFLKDDTLFLKVTVEISDFLDTFTYRKP